MKNCIWHCGRKTKNHTRIRDLCWADSENIYLARKAEEAAEKKPLSVARKAALEKLTATRRAKLAKEIAGTGLSHRTMEIPTPSTSP